MSDARRSPPAVLSIAGSDSGGGAGVQADLKAFARCGVHGMTAITAITAQSTVGIAAIHAIPPEMIGEQVRAVAGDIGVDAVKIGMVGTREAVLAVAQALDELPDGTPVVLDPVMVAESGAVLLDDDARVALRSELLPRATVITPNLLEARVLSGRPPLPEPVGSDASATPPAPADRPAPPAAPADEPADPVMADEPADDAVAALARELHGLGPSVVVVTGGHRRDGTDIVFDGATVTAIREARAPAGAAHGSGCTHSSVLAAQLALGAQPLEAARIAKALATAAVAAGLREIGRGAGPVDVLADLR